MSSDTETEETKSNTFTANFSMRDLPCVKVVIYPDRAEVKRLIKTKLNKGQTELVINNVSNYYDKDSVRVEGIGDARVLDVYCQTKRITESDENSQASEEVKRIKNEIKELEKNEEIISFKLERIMHVKNLLNDFASRLSKPSIKIHTAEAVNEEANLISSSKDNVENFMNFLDLYSSRSEQLDELKYQIRKDIAKIRERLEVARDNLERLNISRYSNHDANEIAILIDSKSDNAEIHLYISYLVSNASWKPKYDIRVYSQDKSMIINYYGMISQSTGEDWNDSIIVLSTAVPSVRGVVPELETQTIRVKPKETHIKHKSVERYRKALPETEILYMDEEPTLETPISKVVRSKFGSTTTFIIPHNATIPSDNSSHKVSIGVINLKPEFEYEAVPRKSPNVFIKAKVKNDSNYLILPGPANVFFDNNFVAKSELETYSPQEEFSCSLGIDSSVKIDYKPIRKQAGHAGLINRCTTISCSQSIEVKNTTQNNVKVLVHDNIPLSSDDKIQVKLIEPVIKSSSNVQINKMNNITFDLNIPPLKTEEIVIKYNIENHSDQEIDFY